MSSTRPHDDQASVRRRTKRSGSILIFVLAVLTVAVTLLAVWARAAASEHRQIQRRIRSLQASLLVEAGLERAAAKLSGASDYSGEIWQIAASDLDSQHRAVVTIRIEPLPGDPSRRKIHIQADYPPEPEWRVRRSKYLPIKVHPLGEPS